MSFDWAGSYQGDCLQASVVDELLENGVNSTSFRSLITWITNELGGLLDLDEQVIKDKKNTRLCFIIRINKWTWTFMKKKKKYNYKFESFFFRLLPK